MLIGLNAIEELPYGYSGILEKKGMGWWKYSKKLRFDHVKWMYCGMTCCFYVFNGSNVL
jgi:hypothetical protein